MNFGYVISTIIAGLILLSLVGLNSRLIRGSGEHTLYTTAKIQSDMIVDYIKDDMRRIGYQVADNPIVYADENRIRFLVTQDEITPVVQVIDWWFYEDAGSNSRNPNVRPLFRRESIYDPSEDPIFDPTLEATAVEIGVGVVDFSIEYLDSQRQELVIGDPATPPTTIRQIGLNILVESLDSYDPNRFERSHWQGEITPRNLRPN